MQVVLRALASVYRGVTDVRGWLYDRRLLAVYRSAVPVVSVGNVTAGGNGKTPLCLALAEEMRRRGYSPAILSRGYGGRHRGPHRVQSSDSIHEVGDEAVLMAQAGFPVFVARKRVAGMQLIEQDPSINLVILDDGFQHRALARSLDIVSVFVGTQDIVDRFIEGRLLPAGMFRESRDRALRRAQIIVLSYRTVEQGAKLRDIEPRIAALLPPSAAVFRSHLVPSDVLTLDSRQVVQPGRVCAIAAIANPEAFFNSLENMGFILTEKFSFPDHHIFSKAELEPILGKYSDQIFVCTLKDAVKLRGLPQEIKSRFAVLSVTAQIVPADAFFVQVERAIQGSRSVNPIQKVTRI